MSKDLFSKCSEGRCAWCMRGRPANDDTKILCERKGIVDSTYCCKKFKYDPLKRVPMPRPELPQFNNDDFSL